MDQLVTFKVHVISNIYIPHSLSCPGPLPILVLLLKNYQLYTEAVRRRREGQRSRREGGTEEEEERGTALSYPFSLWTFSMLKH